MHRPSIPPRLKRHLRLGLLPLAVAAYPSLAIAQDDPVTAAANTSGAASPIDASPVNTSPGQADPDARERLQLETRLERLREETQATEARAKRLGESLVDLAGDEAKLRQRLEETSGRIRSLEGGIADDEAALETLTGEQAEIRRALDEKRTQLATVLMALQRIGSRPPPALAATDGSAGDVVRSAILFNSVIGSLDSEMKVLATTLAEAARLERDEEARWASLREDLTELEGERERLTALIGELERRRAVGLYERDRASAELVRLAEEADTVEALLARLGSGEVEVAAPEGIPFTERKGGLAAPVAGVVVSRYGDATAVGDLAGGRTIAALPRSTVFAPMPATVLYAAPFRTYGHVLILDAGGGYHMVLTGLDETFVSAGEIVPAGAPVGKMGAKAERSVLSAAATDRDPLTAGRPLLYVELRRDGSAIDSHTWWQ